VEGALALYQRSTFTSSEVAPFYKHKANCHSEGAVQLQPTNIPAEVLLIPRNVDETFKVEILSKFSREKVGQLCSSEPTLVSIRERTFMKARVKRDKKTEVERSVTCDMRRLGMLFMHFLEECQQQNLVESSSLVGVKDIPAATDCNTYDGLTVWLAVIISDISSKHSGLGFLSRPVFYCPLTYFFQCFFKFLHFWSHWLSVTHSISCCIAMATSFHAALDLVKQSDRRPYSACTALRFLPSPFVSRRSWNGRSDNITAVCAVSDAVLNSSAISLSFAVQKAYSWSLQFRQHTAVVCWPKCDLLIKVQ